jgi:hypothetical protein
VQSELFTEQIPGDGTDKIRPVTEEAITEAKPEEASKTHHDSASPTLSPTKDGESKVAEKPIVANDQQVFSKNADVAADDSEK